MSTLSVYTQLTQLLLNDQGFEIFNLDDLRRYTNIGRQQVAGQAECVRVLGTVTVSGGSQVYNFSAINLNSASGVSGVLSVRQASYAIGSGYKAMHVRSWPYFQQYFLSQTVPTPGVPTTWSEFQQGTLGSLYVNVVDQEYSLLLDTVCLPNDLTGDTDADAIPGIWTTAVPFFAAYYALMGQGDVERADKFYQEFEKFMARARGAANPSVLPHAYLQTPDPMMQTRLGLQSGRQA